METGARALIDDRRAGALLVAQAHEQIVGVLAASLQTAMHVPGRYALIQDLWVHPSWRSRAIGGALIAALCERAREESLAHVEVGLPRERFARIRDTESFYLRNGFEPLGARLRRVLS
jgi:GNAT superfamily N-acetyltransferase